MMCGSLKGPWEDMWGNPCPLRSLVATGSHAAGSKHLTSHGWERVGRCCGCWSNPATGTGIFSQTKVCGCTHRFLHEDHQSGPMACTRHLLHCLAAVGQGQVHMGHGEDKAKARLGVPTAAPDNGVGWGFTVPRGDDNAAMFTSPPAASRPRTTSRSPFAMA
jgi:hypothetical protein